MAYPQHYLLQFGGPLRTLEVWSCNIRFASGSTLTPAQQETRCDTMKTAIVDWMATTGSGWANNSSQLSYVKFNMIGPDGRYADTGNTHQRVFTPIAGGAGSTNPNQIALCITWTTAKMRGPGSLGRIFMPTPFFSATATGTLSAANQLTVANAAAAFLNAASVDFPPNDIGFIPVVASNVGTNGVLQPITGVKVGNIYDTQRRRRNALVESYVAATTAVTG